MIIKEISVRELPGFLDSDAYRKSQVKPVTAERVFSQVHNPRALPDDIVLIVAYADDGRLAGFTGMLPDTGCSEGGTYRFAWNSGWWTNPKAGQGIAIKLFFRSMQVWKGHYMITDLTRHTRKIVELTRLFYFGTPAQGITLQIRPDFSGKLTRRKKSFLLFLPFTLVADKALNFILGRRLKKWDRKNTGPEMQIEYTKEPDATCLEFMNKHNERELCRRGGKEFEWIRTYPWLVNAASAKHRVTYPFSHVCRRFEFFMAKIHTHGKLAGVVLLTNRDGLFKIPYVYAEPSATNLISCAICSILVDKKAVAFHSFRHEVNEFIEKSAFPYLYKKNVVKELAVSNALVGRQPEKYLLQDGDGDVVFT